MPYIIDPNSKHIEETQESTFQELGFKERQDLEQWVIVTHAMLGEPLLAVTSEYEGFDRTQERLNILAVDKQGKLVLAELKTDDSRPAVELQAIKYAAYCSTLTLADVVQMYADFWDRRDNSLADEKVEKTIRDFISDEAFEDFDSRPRIILAAGKFRPEVTATALWLRSYDVDISCVRLQLLKVEERVVLIPSLIIPLPESIEYEFRQGTKESETTKTTLRNRQDQQLFEELLTEFRDVAQRKALPQSWLALPSGRGSIEFGWTFTGRPRNSFNVSLEFKSSSPEENEQNLQQIKNRAEDLERAIGEQLLFEFPWGKYWARVRSTYPSAQPTAELKKWAVDTMRKYIDSLRPLL